MVLQRSGVILQKMMTDIEDIKGCLTDLIKAETAADYQKALQAANKLIRRYPKELLGYKGKLVALIQLGLYEDALAFIKQSSSAQLGNSTFEHAYVLYRQGLNEAALDVLQGAEDDYKAIELKAQICYKLEKFKEAHELFSWLLNNHSDEDNKVRKANFRSIQKYLRANNYKQRKEAKIEVEDTEIITRKLKNTKRKKKIRLPKNYDPNVPPDPERWLPKRERAAYKKKFKKNRDRDIGRGTQGSANANPNVEFTSASSAACAAPITVEGPRQQRPLKAQKKKKPVKF